MILVSRHMKILVTAGPTREALDPVRFLSNRSTGKMGYAVAEAAQRRGHRVTLVSGPVVLETPSGVERVDVVTAAEMCDAVLARLEACDVLVMAAAVSDWRPADVSTRKRKKGEMPDALRLERTPDILAAAAPFKQGRLYVGFAAETGNPEAEAARKLKEKSLDLIVANDVLDPEAGFAVDTNRVTLIDIAGDVRRLPAMPKTAVALDLVDRITRLWQ